MFCDGFWIVDAHQHGAGRDVLAALDRDGGDAAVTRAPMSTACVYFALHQQGFGRTRYQIEKPAMAAITTPTMISRIRVGAGA